MVPSGRHLVAGQVKFPPWGGNPPAKAKEKEEKETCLFRDLFSMHSSRNDLLGEGGPLVFVDSRKVARCRFCLRWNRSGSSSSG